MPQTKYDVFVSFRGEDILHGFLSHLIATFEMKKICGFVDDKVQGGDEIRPSLVQAIKQSFISLIIFSQNYASSPWCLEELVTILECKEKYGQIVIPVFYRVEPKHLRHQSLQCYQNAFAKHEREYKSKVQIWRRALNKSAGFSGIESSKFRNEAELIKQIVNIVLRRLAKPLVNSKGLVGINEKIADVESLIHKHKKPKDVRLIGIWGIDGIGKTTLSEEIFKKLQSEYEGSYFLPNEREMSSRCGIISLKNAIFSELLADVVEINTLKSLPSDIVRRISHMKVFVVLDDVVDLDHLEKLLGKLDNFGSGSRIIITSKNQEVLKANKADSIYRLRELSPYNALQLFNSIASIQSDHQREYKELLERVAKYAHGIPLLVKVFAGLLQGKNKEEWKSILDKLEKKPTEEVYDVMMKLSYDGLDREEQQIFLDLTCFFLRTDERLVNLEHLKSLLKDGESDNSVVDALKRLKDKALITFSKDNIVHVHHIFQEMTQQIVRQESIDDPGSRSRLWDPEEMHEAWKNDTVAKAIRSMQIRLPTIKMQKLNSQTFAKMRILRFLKISVENEYDCFDQLNIVAEGLPLLASELKYLDWNSYPLKSLPENFSTKNLVILRLKYNRMEKLWDGVKDLVNLKELDLSGSSMLEKLTDLSKAINLEVLILRDCSMLTSVHPSIFSLAKLEKLDLFGCVSLTILTSYSYLCSLRYLNLCLCENLRDFSLISENMKELRLTHSKVKSLPSSFELQSNLKSLFLRANYIERLPTSFNNLTQLLYLDVSACMMLHTISVLPPFLETLNVQSCTSLKTLPNLPHSLKIVHAHFCRSLESLPELSRSLKTLNFESCESLQSLPELPPFLGTLNVQECKSLQSLPELPPSLQTIKVSYCSSLKTLPELPLSLEALDVQSCYSLLTLPELPPSLKILEAQHCKSLQTIPELPQSLKILNANDCGSLQSLPNLPLSLITLTAKNCKSLKSVLLFPSMVVEQSHENKKLVMFWNCLNLDEYSLVVIGLNARINLTKFANQRLSARSLHHDENYDDDDDDEDDNVDYDHDHRQAVYVYPGSSVPEWLEYKTTKDAFIFIDLPSAPPSPLLGFIFCFVLGKYKDTNIIERFDFNITIIDGEREMDSVRMFIDYWIGTIDSDHVCVIYDQRCSAFLINSIAKNQTAFKIQVTMGAQFSSEKSLPQEVLKGFGVSPIHTSGYNSIM